MKTQDIKNMGHAYLSVLEAMKKKKLDPVDKDELKGDHDDRDDKDIDNDGDTDKSDVYLHNRRKAISKASKGKEVETTESVEEAKKVITAKQIKNALSSAKAQAKPKDQVSLKKAPFDIPKESFDVDSLLAIFEELEESQIDLILANLDEHQLDEISNKTINKYRSKAMGQLDKSSLGVVVSKKPETQDKHADRLTKRFKGIGSADKRITSRNPDATTYGPRGRDIGTTGTNRADNTVSGKSADDIKKIKGYSNKKESFDVDSLLAIFENLEESQINFILANLDEQQLDEISNKTIDSYRKKAYGQYKTSADKASDGPWGSAKPETRAKHAARYAKRHKGIGSADKRTMARDPDNFKFGRIGQDGHDPKKDSMSSKTVGDMRKIKGYSNKKESVVYEAMSNNIVDRLHNGEDTNRHMGHEGGYRQHKSAAEDARADGNTKAASSHERAAMSHEHAAKNLKAGKHEVALHHSKDAGRHAMLAVKHGGEETDSHEVHKDHSKAYTDFTGFKSESTERSWDVLNRIMEKATHAGNSDKEKADQGASGKDKEFIKMMGGLDGQDSGIDGAKAAQQTIDSIRASGKVAAKRPGDQDVGDKKIVK
jgi:hypothetical protein